MTLPKGGIPGSGLREDQLVEVVLPLYGLNDAPQRWWATVRETLGELGAVQSIFDFTFEDFELQAYDPHSHIKAAVSV